MKYFNFLLENEINFTKDENGDYVALIKILNPQFYSKIILILENEKAREKIMQQDDEYEEEEEAQVYDNIGVTKNQKGISPPKNKISKVTAKNQTQDKTKTGQVVKKEEKKTSMTQQVSIYLE